MIVQNVIIAILVLVVAFLIADKMGVKMDNVKEKCKSWLDLLLSADEYVKSPFFYVAIVLNVLLLSETNPLLMLPWLVISFVAGIWAYRKGYSFIWTFLLAMFANPFVVLFMIKHWENKRPQVENKSEESEQTKDPYESMSDSDKEKVMSAVAAAMNKQKKGGCLVCFGFLFVLAIVAVVGSGVYLKKVCVDYDGEYAQNRIVYEGEEYGFCVLTTYYPKNRIDTAKGFAITNMSLTEAVEFALEQHRTYYYSIKSLADSKEMFEHYKVMDFSNKLLDMGNLGSLGHKSFDIGKYGSYFVIEKSEVNDLLRNLRNN